MKNLMVTFLLFLSGAVVSWAQVETCFTDAGDFTNEIVLNEQMSTSTGAWNADFSNYQFSGFNSAASGTGMVEFWTISPLFEVANASIVNLNFDVFEDFDETNLDVLISTDYSGTGDPNAAVWLPLTTLDAPEQGGDDYTESISLSIEVGSVITESAAFYVAFRYIDNEGYSRWRVSNITLESDGCVAPDDCANFDAIVNIGCNTSTDPVTYDIEITMIGGDGEYLISDDGAGGFEPTEITTTENTFVIPEVTEEALMNLQPFTVAPTCDLSLGIIFSDFPIPSCTNPCNGDGLYIAGVLDGPLTGGTPKAVQFCTSIDIDDLSVYGLESVSNGSGSLGIEFTGFTGSLAADECFWLTTDAAQFNAYFGFDADYVDGVATINGDDALVLYLDGNVQDVFGETDVDGSGQCWEYQDGYAVNIAGVANCGDFACENYSFSGPNALDDGMNYTDIGEDVFGIGEIVVVFNCDDFEVDFTSEWSSLTGVETLTFSISGTEEAIVVINGGTPFAVTDEFTDIVLPPVDYNITFTAVEDANCILEIDTSFVVGDFCIGSQYDLYIAGVLDGPLEGGTPKAIQLCTSGDIEDLSLYNLTSVSNGNGVVEPEFGGLSGSLEANTCIWITNDNAQFNAYFGFDADYVDGVANINGDDALVLLYGLDNTVTDVFGDPNMDGSGECWEYQDGYAVNNLFQGNCGNFSCENYSFSGPNALDDGMTYADIGEDVFGIGSIFSCDEFTVISEFNCDISTGTFEVFFTSQGSNSLIITNNFTGAIDTVEAIDMVDGVPVVIVGTEPTPGPGYSYTVYPIEDETCLTVFEDLTFSYSVCSLVPCGNLYIAGVLDGPLDGGTPKAIQICGSGGIGDLSAYGFSSANNGGGDSGAEFIFSGNLTTGEDEPSDTCFWLAADAVQFEAYFGFAPDFVDASANVNGDDALILYFDETFDGDFSDASVIDVFGDPDVDGTGQCWDYQDGYAVNLHGSANCGFFDCNVYAFSGPNALDGGTSYADIGEDVFGIGETTPPTDPVVCYADENCDFSPRAVSQNSDSDDWACSDNTYSVNAFCGGSCTEASELWLVSPAFNFGMVDVRTFSMDVTQGFGGDDLTVLWSNDYDGFADPSTATWTALGTIANGTFTADIANIVGDNIYIGIQYTAGGGAGVTADYDVSNIQIISDDCMATALAPPPPCEAMVSPFTISESICPCNGDPAILIGGGNDIAIPGFVLGYVLTNAEGLILDQASGTDEFDFSVEGLADGDYAVYAIDYESLYADEITPLFSIGQNIEGLLNSTDGCFDVSEPTMTSINGDACGCVVDCSGVTPPPAMDIVVCEGGNTTIVLGSTGGWIINEFLANPFDAEISDANNDGVSGPSDEDPFQQSQDEFVEFINDTGFPVDISGWNFTDATNQIRHTFPAGTVVPNGGAVVLFGAGNPTGDFGGAIVQVASGGFIGINDGGDQLNLNDANNNLIVTYGYGGDEAIANISQTRSPELSGAFAAHDVVSPTGAFFSPGTQADGSPFTANTFVYNFYSDAALTDLLAGSVGFYDPQTAAGTAQTLYVTTVDGSCESEATAMTVTVELPPFAEVIALDTLCSIAGGNFPPAVELNDLVVSGMGGVWTDVAGNEIASFDATDLPFGDYSVVYTLSAADGSPCPANSYIVTLRVINCGDACDAFTGPIAQNINLCGDASTEIVPFGAGLTGLFAPEVFLTELHYDNASFDEDEGVELTGTAGFDLAGYQILAYNGNGGVIYETVDLTGLVIPNSGNGYGAIFVDINGLQNGPDGIALVDNLGNLVEFITYEGAFDANEGPAEGTAATDVGSESSSQELGLSIQLSDAGWASSVPSTYNAINEGLTVGLAEPAAITYSFYADEALTTELLSGGTSYDPMTAAGESQSIWVNATDGTCVSEAVEFTIAVETAPTATLTETASICLNEEGGATSIDLNDLIIDGPNGGAAFWSDANGEILFFTTVVEAATYGADTTVVFTYNITPENSESICPSAAIEVSIEITNCEVVDPCTDFTAPTVSDVSVCEGDEAIITPVGGGNGNAVTYNFYFDEALTALADSGESFSGFGSGTIYVTATDGTCESNAVPANIIVFPPIDIEIGPDLDGLCNAEGGDFTTTYDLNQLVPPAAVSAIFFDSAGNEISNIIDGTVLGAGPYDVSIVVTDANACTATANVVIFISDCTEVVDPCEGLTEGPGVVGNFACGNIPVIIAPSYGLNSDLVTYNYYADEALSNLLGSGETYSFTADETTTIYVTATDGTCESAATMALVQYVQPIDGTPVTVAICNDEILDFTTVVPFPALVFDANGDMVTTADGADLGVGTYTYSSIPEGDFPPCGPPTTMITVIVEDCTPAPCETPTATVSGTSICNDANEGISTIVLSSLVTGFQGGTFTDLGGATITSINAQGWSPGNYSYVYTIVGEPGCPSNVYEFSVTVEDCEVDLTACEDFIVQDEIICADDNQTYFVLLTFEGGDAGVNGYNINIGNESFSNVTDPVFAYGPLAGTGYVMSVAVADNPQCIETVSQTVVDCNPTSIELIEFDGEVKENGNLLFWSTASERNTNHFALYRSNNGANFSKVNEQAAAGNSNTIREYDFMDGAAPEGWSYYRLETTDVDGSIEVSEIVSLYRQPKAELSVSISPIPSSNFINIAYQSQSQEALSFQVVNSIGQKVEEWNGEGAIGETTVQKDISSYAAGIYFLNIQQGQAIEVHKFVKK